MEDSSQKHAAQEDSPAPEPFQIAFPPEIWGQITSYLSIYDLRILKLMGSKALWRRLCAPRAVSSVRVLICERGLQSWPALLDEFRWLTSLSICCKDGSKITFAGATLGRLPKTLRKLKIKAPGICLADIASNDASGANIAGYLPNLEHLDLNLDWESTGPWLGKIPPNLTFLRCLLCEWHSLPPTLLHLSVNSIFPRQINVDSSPENLDKTSESKLKLPQHLEDLKILDVDVGLNSLEQLPRTLTCLILPRTSFKASDRPLSLPPLLTTLQVQSMATSFWKQLPLGLKSMKMADVIIHPQYDPLVEQVLPMEDLPVSLVALEVTGELRRIVCDDSPPSTQRSPSTLRAHRFFPPLLESLQVKGWLLSPAATKQLPATLTSLHTYRLTDTMCCHLPRTLKTLTVAEAIPSDAVVQNLPHLPPTLTSFVATFLEPRSHFVDDSTGERATFKLKERPWRMCDLPSRLTSLTWSQTIIGSDFLDHHNLNHLTTLNLVSCFIEWKDETFSKLPPGLTMFGLGAFHCSSITGKCFSKLPRGLTKLNVWQLTEVQDEDIKHLPPGITYLNLNLAVKLTNFCIKDLPTELVILVMGSNKNITVDGYYDLPAPLRGPSGLFYHDAFKGHFKSGSETLAASRARRKEKLLHVLLHRYSTV